MTTFKEPFPRGPCPDNPCKPIPAGEAVESEPHHAAVHAVSLADRLTTLRHALNVARRMGKHERADQLVAAITELEGRAP